MTEDRIEEGGMITRALVVCWNFLGMAFVVSTAVGPHRKRLVSVLDALMAIDGAGVTLVMRRVVWRGRARGFGQCFRQ